ncbi:dihydrolipoamide acetyltransferase family protein [Sphingomonas humi]|uniref:Dihydrolipoamide acetyltransferase component of pyruvate dehydrogenase complex n=1 Tax=Sphingomonas humi TaxID=335630 RepID=A0ABP7SDZ7_9SPHN
MIDVRVPDEQEGTKAVVRAWLKQPGDQVAVNDPLVELETDKVTQEVPSPIAGVLAEILLGTDAEAVPGAVLGRIEAGGESTIARPERSAESVVETPSHDRASNARSTNDPGDERETRLSPSVRRALLQHDIDPARVTGTGRNGRITREDVDRAVETATVSHVDGGSMPIAQPRVSEANWQDIPHDRMRRAIAENMARAVTDAPHVTALFEADFTAITAHKKALAAQGTRLSYTAYLLKAAAEAMAVAPTVNGRWAEDRIIVAPTVDIGVGTALGDKGLVVPVVRDCARLGLEEVGARLDELTARARSGKLERSDVANGSFTISNHGVSGSLLAAPIILHQGQAAILGVGKLQKRVVVLEQDGSDVIAIRPMAYVTLTIDHRVLDGHQTNAWLSRFVEIIENWPVAQPKR